MKVSKAVSAALLAVAAIAGSAGAFASQAPGQASSDLFVAVWNPTTNTSIVQDLGVTPYNPATNNTNPFVNLTSGSDSWTLDGGNLAADLGAGTYQYQVFAADNTSPNQYAGVTMYLSLAAGASIPVIQNGDLVNSGMTAVSTYIVNYMSGATTLYKSAAGDSSASPDFWGNNLGPGANDAFTIANLTGVGGTTVGNALNLILYTGSPSDQPSDNVLSSAVGNGTTRGLFDISGSTLSYSIPSSVPLPAAGWLLISGLLGLMAVSRRRNGEVV